MLHRIEPPPAPALAALADRLLCAEISRLDLDEAGRHELLDSSLRPIIVDVVVRTLQGLAQTWADTTDVLVEVYPGGLMEWDNV